MRKLRATVNDNTLALIRLVLGVVFFLYGSQKMLGSFGGLGFRARCRRLRG
jgi:putative oxidoreductase